MRELFRAEAEQRTGRPQEHHPVSMSFNRAARSTLDNFNKPVYEANKPAKRKKKSARRRLSHRLTEDELSESDTLSVNRRRSVDYVLPPKQVS